MKKKYIILFIIIVIILLGVFITINKKNNLKEIDYKTLVNKIEKKESFILCITKTTCSHCQTYKPKLKKIANKYNMFIYYIEADKLTDDEAHELNKHFSYSGTPVTLFVNDGKEKTAVNRLEGDISSEKIINKLKSNGFIK